MGDLEDRGAEYQYGKQPIGGIEVARPLGRDFICSGALVNVNLLRRLSISVLGLLKRREQADEHPWCLVGNIVDENPKGDSKEIVRGTKRFSPGTKVFCMAPQWGDGYESVVVIGRVRGSKRLITIVQRSSNIANWRAKPVYHPEVMRRLKEGWDGFNAQWKSKKEVEQMIKYLQKRAAKERDPTRH